MIFLSVAGLSSEQHVVSCDASSRQGPSDKNRQEHSNAKKNIFYIYIHHNRHPTSVVSVYPRLSSPAHDCGYIKKSFSSYINHITQISKCVRSCTFYTCYCSLSRAPTPRTEMASKPAAPRRHCSPRSLYIPAFQIPPRWRSAPHKKNLSDHM